MKIVGVSTSPFPYRDNITDGPGYRAWHLLQELAKKHEIVILSLYESFHLGLKKEFEVSEARICVKCTSHLPSKISKSIAKEKPDLIYLPWSSTPFLSRLNKKIPTVLDYVGPGLLEDYATRGYISTALLQTKLKSFWLGDFFMTAGQRERYYLLGLLAASKKLSVGKHAHAYPLIHVIPITPPPDPPTLTEKTINKRTEELVLLVAGAFLPWYDYATFFEALKILFRKGKRNFKVVFMGGNQKDPKLEDIVRKMGDVNELKNNLVFTGLVPFKKRVNYYLQADVAVNIPSITIEDELSVRTRVVDYMWARLPIITPAKDEYSSIATEEGGGFQYEVGNPSSLAETIEMLVDDKNKISRAKCNTQTLLDDNFNLKKHISPLESFIENPYIAQARLSPKGINSEIFLWMRDVMNLLKR